MKQNHIILLCGIVGLAALIIMLTTTSPTEIGPLGVLLFFTTVYFAFFSLFAALIFLFRKIALKYTSFRNKDYLYSAVLAFIPIMFLMARSFGAINLWTTTLIVLFLALAEFLVYKRI